MAIPASTIRSRARNLARTLAIESGYALSIARGGLQRALDTPRVHIVYLHGVESRDVDRFRGLIENLATRHTFISYSDAMARIWSGDIDRPYITVSFDDGFANAMNGGRVLDEFGIKAIFFICSSHIGISDPTDVKNVCLSRYGIPAKPFMSWDDLEILTEQGHEIGCHTATHANLATLSREELVEEIAHAKDALESRGFTAVHFAWPFGRMEEFSTEAHEVVLDAGFVSCASAIRGAHFANSERGVIVRREHIVSSWPLRHVRYLLARSVDRNV